MWSDPVVECIYVFSGNVATRGITLMRPPSESLWVQGATNPRRWATDDDDLLARYQGGSDALEPYFENAPAPTASAVSDDLKHRTDWKFRCRYWYASTDQANGFSGDGVGTSIPVAPSSTVNLQGVRYMPTLVRSETQMRVGGGVLDAESCVPVRAERPVLGHALAALGVR